MAQKYYAVKNGKKTGIFGTWNQCKEQVTGFKGAIYKSFLTLDEAKAYISGEDANKIPDELFTGVLAYVDGSYNVKTGEYSYGVAILDGENEHHFYEKFSDELSDMRNVAGEIRGSAFAMKYCMENNIKQVKIFHDYEGISRWCLGEWKTNKDGTKAYKAYYDSIKDNLSVEFVKVKSHSGDKYNDIADILAKKALGLV